MTTPVIDALASMINAQIETAFQGHHARMADLTDSIERLDGQATHLVQKATAS